MPLLGFAEESTPVRPRHLPGLRPFRFGIPALCFSRLVAAFSWFFGPSLLPPFDGSLHYYGLCWLLPRSRAGGLPG